MQCAGRWLGPLRAMRSGTFWCCGWHSQRSQASMVWILDLHLWGRTWQMLLPTWPFQLLLRLLPLLPHLSLPPWPLPHCLLGCSSSTLRRQAMRRLQHTVRYSTLRLRARLHIDEFAVDNDQLQFYLDKLTQWQSTSLGSWRSMPPSGPSKLNKLTVLNGWAALKACLANILKGLYRGCRRCPID